MGFDHFSYWHETDIPKYLGNVRYWVNSGKHVLASSISEFDPELTERRIRASQYGAMELGGPTMLAGA
jgi:hypothetical protein